MFLHGLTQKHPIKQAVWTGSTIAAIWSSGMSLRVKIFSRGDLTSTDSTKEGSP